MRGRICDRLSGFDRRFTAVFGLSPSRPGREALGRVTEGARPLSGHQDKNWSIVRGTPAAAASETTQSSSMVGMIPPVRRYTAAVGTLRT